MKFFRVKLCRWIMAAVFFVIFVFMQSDAPVYAHGGEDHGDEKTKTAASEKGTLLLHTSRLGDLEITLKHPLFAPDTPSSARLFITKFETNEPFEQANPVVEIESADGSVLQAAAQKSEAAGSYTLDFPALPPGVYTIRAKLSYDGETDTATFSGVSVSPAASVPAAEGSGNGDVSRAQILLMALVGLIVLTSFGGLVYFVFRLSKGEPIGEETVSV